jgi:hypothetical protein
VAAKVRPAAGSGRSADRGRDRGPEVWNPHARPRPRCCDRPARGVREDWCGRQTWSSIAGQAGLTHSG